MNPILHLTTLGDYRQRPPRRERDAAAGSPSLEDRLERLALTCMAMWSLIQSETKLTEDDLLQRVKEIDLMAA